MLLMACFVSCTENEYYIVAGKEDVEEQEKSYTIMMYGCGGGNLDKAMIINIQEALLEGTAGRVKFTGQVKFSARFQDTEEFGGTQRFVVGPENGLWYSPVQVLDKDLELNDPKNLTDFINWSKQQCPADEYILLLWNHGSAWLPRMDARAIIHDDSNKPNALTLNGLVQGVKDSGTKMKMIYFDACLMGMAEVLTGVSECADYALCATHVTPNMGGDYNSLIYNLNNYADFETAMAEYGREVIRHWESDGLPLDIKLVDLSKMNPFLEDVKELSGYLADAARITSAYRTDINNGVAVSPTSNEAIIAANFEKALNSCYLYFWEYDKNNVPKYPFYDIHMLSELMAGGRSNSYSARFINISSRINRSLKDVIVSEYSTTASSGWKFSLGVTVVDKEAWTRNGYYKTYSGLKFDQQTGWGEWLSINPVAPKGNPNPFTISGVSDDEEEEPEIPLEEEIEEMLKMIGKR